MYGSATGHFGHLFMGCMGRVQQPHWLRAGFKQPVAITGQARPLDRQQLAQEVNRKYYFEHHNHVLSSNYTTRQGNTEAQRDNGTMH